MTSSICNSSVQRDQLEYALVSGAAIILAQDPSNANYIATGIKNVLDALHPRDVAGEPLKAALGCAVQACLDTLAIPVIDPDSLEREIQAKASKGPRVTPDALQAEIASEHYFTARQGAVHHSAHNPCNFGDVDIPALGLLTFCVLVLRNGFTVTGEQACASPENFDAEIGRKIARENAINKLWPLMGYALKTKLASA